MARYLGPRAKKARRYNVALFGPCKALEKRPYPPGVHGEKSRRKQSDYAIALAEKQKLRLMYGVTERQLRRYFASSLKKRGVTGEVLLQFLESRLDNIVHRLGFATTRFGARQMITHGHVQVNGGRIMTPSFRTRPGDVVEVRDQPQSRKLALRNLEAMQAARLPDWLVLEKEKLRGEVRRLPSKEELRPIANEQLVVEFYS
ncbi:30S ribosomal protein S4 [Verrucomicrobium sp. 3C]|uniref:30S ribosomal protein S4 n=1 Tax=Verrucomicrobium sp. 3C TaxID=1134055 RepID=UPI00036A4AC4|nr:30S ribosomal protein S4 [Verrucomicrobium sp. 3C]